MGRGFLSRQLVDAETELVWVAKHADYLGLELGELADEIHFEGAAARPVDEALITVRELRTRIDRVEGLLGAYRMMFEGKGAA